VINVIPAENFKLILGKKMSFLFLSLGFRKKIWKESFKQLKIIHKMFSKKTEDAVDHPVDKISRSIHSIIKVHFHYYFASTVMLFVVILNKGKPDSPWDTLIS
jgi:hypothetical protein